MLLTYLNTLKNKGNFTFEGIAKLSGIPEGTIKNVFSGKTEDPRFETVASIVVAMGGSLDAIYAAAKTEDVEANAVIALKETQAQRITELKEYYEHLLTKQEKHYERLLTEAEKHIETIKLDKRWFRLAAVVSVVAMFGLFIFIEAITPGHGWFRY